jgi:signal transduction histidine kinase
VSGDGTAPVVLLLAPVGRDAQVAGRMLAEIGLASTVCDGVPALADCLDDSVAFVVVTDEATRGADLRRIAGWVAAQPSWSDLSFIVLTSRGGGPERNPVAGRLSDVLGSVTFVERPFHPTTFVSVARTALRGRLRQYEARQRLEELSESEARLRTALTAGRLGTWELDLESYSLVSCAICRACFGRRPDEPFTYHDLLAALLPDDMQRLREAVQRSKGVGEDLVAEHRVLGREGETSWVALRARLVQAGDTEAPRLVGVMLDVTERRAVEDGLRRLAETLEERVAERTAELEEAHAAVLKEVAQREETEQQLRQAQKMETLGQLTGGVAHDFNNLLAAVIGNLEILRRHHGGDDRAVRLIDGALSGALRGATLTQRMLAFARQQELDPKPVDLGALVRGMTSLLERSVGGGAELVYEIDESLPSALADANQLELALLNLVVNARDAMPNGGAIRVRLERIRADEGGGIPAGDYVRLAVIDTGTGMDAETLRRAVEPFFSTKEIGKGTGLGLSMIEGLAMQLNGALRLASEPGRGTTAELLLPAAAHASDPEPAMPQDQPTVAAPMTILLVEDDALIAMSTAGLLEDLGHRVVEASRGAEALEILREQPGVDLMITDYSMPGMSGADVARAARALRPDLPILLATGFAELPDGEELKLPRLRKPYMQHQLAAEIARLVGSVGAAENLSRSIG